MSSHHIRHGIDLGTTNSAIALVDRGAVRILKNDFGHDTAASAIHYASRGVRVGQRARSQWFRERLGNVGSAEKTENAFLEFKRTMGGESRYAPSARSDIAVSSEELSAEVLKELLRFARLRGGEDSSAAVVTIPAAFKVPQQQATQQAATLAGIEQCHLLQEPVAAAMAFGLEAEPGASVKWLVFDFGGGTFDAALVLAEAGSDNGQGHRGRQPPRRKGPRPRRCWTSLLWPEIAEAGVRSDDLYTEADQRSISGKASVSFAEGALIGLSTQDPSFIVESDDGHSPRQTAKRLISISKCRATRFGPS